MSRSFKEVFKQMTRMCNAIGCGSCPLYDGATGCTGTPNNPYSEPEKIEEAVTRWVEDNPEKQNTGWLNRMNRIDISTGDVIPANTGKEIDKCRLM